MKLTRHQNIKRDEYVTAYDICDCTNYECQALADASENNEVVKLEFDDSYIIYAQWIEENNLEQGYWEIDTGDCH